MGSTLRLRFFCSITVLHIAWELYCYVLAGILRGLMYHRGRDVCGLIRNHSQALLCSQSTPWSVLSSFLYTFCTTIIALPLSCPLPFLFLKDINKVVYESIECGLMTTRRTTFFQAFCNVLQLRLFLKHIPSNTVFRSNKE